jgi:hypothetical protein
VADLWRALRALDVGLLRLLRTRGHAAPIETAVVRLAQSGENGLIWHGIAAAGVAVHASKRPGYARTMMIVLSTLVANTALKKAVGRARPVLEEELPALACAMALSRPYLGVHYPSDILAGALLGDALARLLTR